MLCTRVAYDKYTHWVALRVRTTSSRLRHLNCTNRFQNWKKAVSYWSKRCRPRVKGGCFQFARTIWYSYHTLKRRERMKTQESKSAIREQISLVYFAKWSRFARKTCFKKSIVQECDSRCLVTTHSFLSQLTYQDREERDVEGPLWWRQWITLSFQTSMLGQMWERENKCQHKLHNNNLVDLVTFHSDKYVTVGGLKSVLEIEKVKRDLLNKPRMYFQYFVNLSK